MADPRRHWTRDYFLDHPRYRPTEPNKPLEVWFHTGKDGVAESVPGSGKPKVGCMRCLEYEIGRRLEAEAAQALGDPAFQPRDSAQIRLDLFNGPRDLIDNSTGEKYRVWHEGRGGTLVTHLRFCQHQPQEIRQMANEFATRNTGTLQPPPIASPSSQPIYPPTIFTSVPLPPYDYPVNFTTSPMIGSIYAPPGDLLNYGAPTPSPTEATPLSPLLMSVTPEPASRSVSPAPSAAIPGSRGRTSTVAGTKRTASMSRSSSLDMSWPPERQARFEERLVKLVASADLSLSWVENPEFIAFCQEFIPCAQIPSRKTLSDRLLPRVLKEIRLSSRHATQGLKATVQCDGWTGLNNQHFHAFMVTTSARTLYTVRVVNSTTERKTAENLLVMMKEVIKELKDQWGVDVIAFTTDASGESRKARRLLRIEIPRIVAPDCWAHQVNLIVGDYFKVNGVAFLVYATKANELITWLRSKTAVLGLIRAAAQKHGGRQPYSVIRPVATRWTAYFLAYRRLSVLQPTLDYVILSDKLLPRDQQQLIPSKDRRAIAKAQEMVCLIQDKAFWDALERVQSHLLPLAIAANITQSAFCRLDEVALTFGSLYWTFNTFRQPDEHDIREHVQHSIQTRWAKCDQEACLAAIILNPFIKLVPFNKAMYNLISMAALEQLFTSLWTRFFGGPVPLGLYDDIDAYLNSRVGTRYEYLDKTCTRLRGKAEQEKQSPDPLQAYADITVPGDTTELPPIIRLAHHIFAICANSASCERLFSTFGLILTKLRSRLGHQKLQDLAELKLHLRDEHLRQKTKEHFKRRARAFAAANEPRPEPSLTSAPHIRGIPQSAGSQVSSSIPSRTTTPAPNIDLPPGEPESEESIFAAAENAGHAITATLEGMRTRLEAAVDEDHDATPPASRTIHLQELFTYEGIMSVGYSFQKKAETSLDEEEEIYELVDTNGNIEIEPDIDEIIGSVVTPC